MEQTEKDVKMIRDVELTRLVEFFDRARSCRAELDVAEAELELEIRKLRVAYGKGREWGVDVRDGQWLRATTDQERQVLAQQRQQAQKQAVPS